MRGNISSVIVCLSEVILSASLLYSNTFSIYIVKNSVYRYWSTVGLKLVMILMFLGLYRQIRQQVQRALI